MYSNKLLIICIFAQLYLGHAGLLANYQKTHQWRDVIYNEVDLVGTCTGTCGEVGVVAGQEYMLQQNCSVVKDCKFSTIGWNDGFVRCDYCNCKCEDSRPEVPDVTEVVEKREFTEEQLYGTCTETCSHSGLVRTNWGGCNQVRDCEWKRNGWLKWFVRCDYCLCDCYNEKFISSYHLKNVRYNIDANKIEPGKPMGFSTSYAKNLDPVYPLQISRWVRHEFTDTLSVTTSASLSTGIEMTVDGGIGPLLHFGTTTKIEAGFTSTTGKVYSHSHMEALHADFEVAPLMQCKISISGTNYHLDVPYSAELVTIYDDGSTESEQITGIFKGVETNSFDVDGKDCKDLEN